MPTSPIGQTDQQLVGLGRARAGSNQKLAAALGCSSRTISLAAGGSQQLPEEVRRRLASYLASGSPTTAPKLLPGRQPVAFPEGGAMKYQLLEGERRKIMALAQGHPRGQTGVLTQAIQKFIEAHPKALPPVEALTDGCVPMRTRLDPPTIRLLNERIQKQFSGSLTLRAAYIRAAIMAFIKATPERKS